MIYIRLIAEQRPCSRMREYLIETLKTRVHNIKTHFIFQLNLSSLETIVKRLLQDLINIIKKKNLIDKNYDLLQFWSPYFHYFAVLVLIF